jgi:quercetin dioxygenase-like cupin family protein
MRSISAVAIFSSLALTTAARAQAPAIKWGPAPAVFPAGVRMAVLAGDPGQPGVFTVRLELPAGTRVQPHFHPTDEYLTVISGTFLVGMGDSLDVAKSTVLPAGAFVTVGANMHHYASARGRTVVQVSAMGPFVLTYVHPQDQPQTASNK